MNIPAIPNLGTKETFESSNKQVRKGEMIFLPDQNLLKVAKEAGPLQEVPVTTFTGTELPVMPDLNILNKGIWTIGGINFNFVQTTGHPHHATPGRIRAESSVQVSGNILYPELGFEYDVKIIPGAGATGVAFLGQSANVELSGISAACTTLILGPAVKTLNLDTKIGNPASFAALTHLDLGSVERILHNGINPPLGGSLTTLHIPESLQEIGGHTELFGPANIGTLILSSPVVQWDTHFNRGSGGGEGGCTLNTLVVDMPVTPPFQGSTLQALVLTDKVVEIGSNSFYYCESLTAVTIPASVTVVGSMAFAYCSALTVVHAACNYSVIEDEDDAFEDSALTTVYVAASATGWTLGSGKTIGGKSGVTVAAWTSYPDPMA